MSGRKESKRSERRMGFSDRLSKGRWVFTGRITHMVEGPNGKIWKPPMCGQRLPTKKGVLRVEDSMMFAQRGGFYFTVVGRIVKPFKS